MNLKNERIALVVRQFGGRRYDAHYLGFFECFNTGLFYEAHEVLETIWLNQRQERNGAFYKALIQLAGAFVHLQKDRLRPAVSLFRLANGNLESYETVYEGLDLSAVRQLIVRWMAAIEGGGYESNPLLEGRLGSPRLVVNA